MSPLECSESLSKIAPALLAAQKALKNPEKNAKNPHFGNHYADLGACMASALAALNKNNISIIQLPAPAAVGTVALRTTILHTSGEYLSSVCTIPLDRDNAQGYGSALTYARRYGVSGIVGMVAEDDDDGNGACKHRSGGGEEPEERAAPSKSAPKKGLFGNRR